MTKHERLAVAAVGLPVVWLFLLDTGLMHYGGYGAAPRDHRRRLLLLSIGNSRSLRQFEALENVERST